MIKSPQWRWIQGALVASFAFPLLALAEGPQTGADDEIDWPAARQFWSFRAPIAPAGLSRGHRVPPSPPSRLRAFVLHFLIAPERAVTRSSQGKNDLCLGGEMLLAPWVTEP